MKKEININSFARIEREKILQGRFVPGIINNCDRFFLTNLEVFEDGTVDAWELVDLNIFKSQLKSGWVRTAVPDGENINIHNLGDWKVKSGNWTFDKDSYFKYIQSIVKNMNPEMTNLYDSFGETTKMVGKFKVSLLGMGNGVPYDLELENNPFSNKYKGAGFHIFMKASDEYYHLVNAVVLENSTINLAGMAETRNLTFDQFHEKIKAKTFTTKLKKGARLKIYGLGECTIGKCNFREKTKDIAGQTFDLLAKLKGEKTRAEICKTFYEQYCQKPNKQRKNLLREAYENVPEHLRAAILHDMDAKDIPIRMIIYGKDEIENWSHYAVAKAQGQKLPTIDVPEEE